MVVVVDVREWMSAEVGDKFIAEVFGFFKDADGFKEFVGGFF